MKAIKITEDNIQAIQLALIAANGKSCTHTYSVNAIIDIAEAAEIEVIGLLGNKKDAVGAKIHARSGDKVPNAYKYGRQVNRITIERRSSGWHLVYIGCITITEKRGAYSRLTVTPKQDAQAIARFKKSYEVKA